MGSAAWCLWGKGLPREGVRGCLGVNIELCKEGVSGFAEKESSGPVEERRVEGALWSCAVLRTREPPTGKELLRLSVDWESLKEEGSHFCVRPELG